LLCRTLRTPPGDHPELKGQGRAKSSGLALILAPLLGQVKYHSFAFGNIISSITL